MLLISGISFNSSLNQKSGIVTPNYSARLHSQPKTDAISFGNKTINLKGLPIEEAKTILKRIPNPKERIELLLKSANYTSDDMNGPDVKNLFELLNDEVRSIPIQKKKTDELMMLADLILNNEDIRKFPAAGNHEVENLYIDTVKLLLKNWDFNADAKTKILQPILESPTLLNTQKNDARNFSISFM